MKLDRDNLIDNLKKLKLQIVFTKTGGDMRGMFCTLREDCLPKGKVKGKNAAKTDSDTLISVWDLEKEGWRSFHCDKIAAILQMEEEVE